ncbi:MAG: hypothetical protein MHM6MM_006385 [Cercozoa sp. M6MM]
MLHTTFCLLLVCGEYVLAVWHAQFQATRWLRRTRRRVRRHVRRLRRRLVPRRSPSPRNSLVRSIKVRPYTVAARHAQRATPAEPFVGTGGTSRVGGPSARVQHELDDDHDGELDGATAGDRPLQRRLVRPLLRAPPPGD